MIMLKAPSPYRYPAMLLFTWLEDSKDGGQKHMPRAPYARALIAIEADSSCGCGSTAPTG